MASLGNPRTWIPYVSNRDCSKGFCSLYCPQWCYIIHPPPPPFEYADDNSSPNFSPLVIAIIGILASAFLLVTYYVLISKYCGQRELSQRENHDQNDELQDMNQIPSLHEPWHVSTTGLDESLIKSITVCKYKKGEGLVEIAECSVCLNEFEDDESVRLLPKCSHAFHLPCIDTWLKSHFTCPLCRSSIFTFNASAPQVAAPVAEIELPSRNENETSSENQHEVENVAVTRDNDFRVVEEERVHAAKPELRAFSDLGNLQGRHSTIEIRDEVCDHEPIRRSVSMDNCFQRGHFSVADVLNMNQEDDSEAEGYANNEAGTSKRSRGEGGSKSGHSKRRVLRCVLSPISMKRSFSSGRFLLGRNNRGRRQGIIPL